MSNPHQVHLPQEILDYIVDLLRDTPETLEQCCLVLKSWVSRTRKYLFADIEFFGESDLDAWKKTFPDPTRSPVHYTHTLRIACIWAVEEADAEEGGWIPTFSRVNDVRLRYGNTRYALFDESEISKVSFAPFRQLSSSIRSLGVTAFLLPYSRVWDLIRSLPLLEDPTLSGYDDDDEWDSLPAVSPSASPVFTGTLDFLSFGRMRNITRRLLDLPDGLRFRRLVFSWCYQDLRWMQELVAAYSHPRIPRCHVLPFHPASIDLSKATKLRDVIFRPGSLNIAWITTALQNVSPEHRNPQISIYLRYDLVLAAIEPDAMQTVGGQWLDLDHLLVQFWESRSIQAKLVCSAPEEEPQGIGEHIGRLLPEVTGRGIIDLVE
ncbi:hypothetical protein BDM02DRAFT_604385 [Thelephora ganbajun]|uniref:Uncharacterized protein n=1 Tax=Thelephora ganbajun TaxID=370292 RepID=A0ACB6Z7J2_THEGA|nr:hypothetical protein BDM02DRAFT_604385 [Thelephora ganbajun]